MSNKDKIAVFPGSFDPLTKGHESVVKRALPLFDKIYVAVGKNITKAPYFTLEERVKHIEQTFKSEKKIEAIAFEGLTVDFCKKVKANFILRGVRNTTDFEYEKNIAQMNKVLYPKVETVFILTDAEFAAINSTIVREILRNGVDVSAFIPSKVKLR
ncbi:MAG: pantetheine-phosphate adenylyltransferase [Flavobacteriales bacterium]